MTSAAVKRAKKQVIGQMAVDQDGRIGIVEELDRRPGGSVFVGKMALGEGRWSARHPRVIHPQEAAQIVAAFEVGGKLAQSVRDRAEKVRQLPRWKRWFAVRLGLVF